MDQTCLVCSPDSVISFSSARSHMVWTLYGEAKHKTFPSPSLLVVKMFFLTSLCVCIACSVCACVLLCVCLCVIIKLLLVL